MPKKKRKIVSTATNGPQNKENTQSNVFLFFMFHTNNKHLT